MDTTSPYSRYLPPQSIASLVFLRSCRERIGHFGQTHKEPSMDNQNETICLDDKWTPPSIIELTDTEIAEQTNLTVVYGTSEDNPYDDRDHY